MKLIIRGIGLKLSMNDLELDKLKDNLSEANKMLEAFIEIAKVEDNSNKKK